MSIETWVAVATSISLVIISVVTAMISIVALRNSRNAAATQVFLELRKRYLEVLAQMPAQYHNNYWVPIKGSNEWNALSSYWYQTFNEWYMTKKLYKGTLSELWDGFYKGAIGSGLRNRPLRIVLVHLLANESSFSGYASEFERDICQLSDELAEELALERNKHR